MAEFERLWKIYKVTDFEIKYITTVDWDNFTTDIVDDSMRSKNLVDKTDISGLINNADLNKKLETLAAKVELKAE